MQDALKTEQPSTLPQASRETHRRYLAVWFPFLSADRLHKGNAAQARSSLTQDGVRFDEAPLVLVAKERGALRIAATDRKASLYGLMIGMTVNGGVKMCHMAA